MTVYKSVAILATCLHRYLHALAWVAWTCACPFTLRNHYYKCRTVNLWFWPLYTPERCLMVAGADPGMGVALLRFSLSALGCFDLATTCCLPTKRRAFSFPGVSRHVLHAAAKQHADCASALRIHHQVSGPGLIPAAGLPSSILVRLLILGVAFPSTLPLT